MNRSLMRAVLEYAIFLGLSEDDVLPPDIAVSQLEKLSLILKGLAPYEREAFNSFIQETMDAESKDSQSVPLMAFLSSLAENLGLSD